MKPYLTSTLIILFENRMLIQARVLDSLNTNVSNPSRVVQPISPQGQLAPTNPIDQNVQHVPTNINEQNFPGPTIPLQQILPTAPTYPKNPTLPTQQLLPTTNPVVPPATTLPIVTTPPLATAATVATTNPIITMPPSTTNKEQTHALWTTSQPPVPTVTYIVPTVWTTANQPVQTSIIPTTPINVIPSLVTSINTDSYSVQNIPSTDYSTFTQSSDLPFNTTIAQADGSTTGDTIRLGLIIGACGIFLAALGIFAFRAISLRASDKFKARLDDPIDSREYDSAPFPKRNPPNQYAFPSTSRENGSYFSADSTPRPSIDYSSNSAPPQTMMDYNNRQYQSVYANESQRPSFDYTSNESISPPTNGSDQISNAPAVTAYQYQGYTRPGPYAPTSGSLSPYFSTNAASNSAPGSDTYSYGPNASNTSSPGVGNYIPVAPADITPRTSFTYPPIVPGNSFSVHNPPYNWKGNDPNKNFNSPVGTSYSRPKPYEQPENAEIPILDQSENAEIPILDLSEQAEIPVIIKKQKQENEHRVEGVSQSAVRENEGKGENTIDMPPIIDSKK